LHVPNESGTINVCRAILLSGLISLIVTPLIKPADQLIYCLSNRIDGVVSRDQNGGAHGEEFNHGSPRNGDTEESLSSAKLSILKSFPHINSTSESNEDKGGCRSIIESNIENFVLTNLVTDDGASSVEISISINKTDDGLRNFINHVSGSAKLNNKTHSGCQVKCGNWPNIASKPVRQDGIVEQSFSEHEHGVAKLCGQCGKRTE